MEALSGGVAARRHAMLLKASIIPERERDYPISKTYYTVQDAYFYFRPGPAPRSEFAADMHGKRPCGEAGFNYLDFMVRPEEVDT